MTAASVTRSTVTPADLTITPRDRRFVDKVQPARWWNGGDPVATAFYNALSATFPKGEAFFVESVRQFRGVGRAPLDDVERGDFRERRFLFYRDCRHRS